MEWEAGAVVTGRVSGITKFGAFVTLPGGKSGLVHISEVSNSFVSDVHDFLTEGQEVQVKILAISPDGKINLSIKQLQDAPVQRPTQPKSPRNAAFAGPASAPLPPSGDVSFEDKLKQFMSLSDSKQSEFNRHMAGKRGGRRRK